MKQSIIFTLLALFIAGTAFSQTARIQVIHNAADTDAEMVDVYVNDDLFLDDFAFRTATPFTDVPAGVNLKIDIAPATSSSSGESLYTMNATLTENEKYILIANGLLDGMGDSAFDIYVYDMAREAADQSGNTDVLVFHGATDAPVVDVFESYIPAETVVDNLAYGQFQGYLELGTMDYTLEVRDETGTVTVASYEALLETLMLEDAAITVLASGFLAPEAGEAAFGLFVALPSGGDLVALDHSMANVQIIHNSADMNAEMVDVYLNDELLLDDFAFRTATPFVEVKAGVDSKIDIAPSNSMSSMESIYNLTAPLNTRGEYIIVANGIVSESGYEPNVPFELFVYDMAQQNTSASNTNVLVFHGATDAPVVDVFESSVPAGTIVDNLAYGDFAGYLELATADYILDIRDETGAVTVARFMAPLQTLGLDGVALTVLASGFLTPENNSNGAPFGLYAALPAGGELVELPLYSPTGISDLQGIEFNMYPNPAKEFINVNLTSEENAVLNIYNSVGQMVKTVNLRNNETAQISLNDLQTGMYIVELRTAQASQTGKLQIVK